jgi:ABC-type enterochelin transport system ATPase subunit
MKFQPGDTILLLHSNEEGEVVEILNDKMILVDVEGVRFPVYTDQVDFPYFKRFSEKKIVVPKKEKIYIDNLKKEKVTEKNQMQSGLWLSFLPVFDKDIFDEATSSLDSLTEEEITNTIKNVSSQKEQITILIAHRLSTIMHADRIYVLERGEIIETGSHQELLEKTGLYYAMWRQQIGERKKTTIQPEMAN